VTAPVSTFLAVVVPVYNEDQILPTFHARLCATLATLVDVRAEVIYINDGSTDDTLARLNALRTDDSRVTILNLSRNYGKEIALSAGLDHANADAVIVIDADLQDPPPNSFRSSFASGSRVSMLSTVSVLRATARPRSRKHRRLSFIASSKA
jgi:polyisoprenyl-phosphate glycosyltransferase